MDLGNIWNSLYTSQLMGTQLYGLQSDPFSAYGSYADAWQATPWQYGLQTGALYGSGLQQSWQYAGFTDTLQDALTKYSESLRNTGSADADTDMEVSSHKGNVLQLGYDQALVYLPEEQKIMIVQAAGNTETAGNGKQTGSTAAEESAGSGGGTGTARRTKTTGVSGTRNIEEKGILVNQRNARASAAYRRTQRAGQQNSLWAKNGTGIQ